MQSSCHFFIPTLLGAWSIRLYSAKAALPKNMRRDAFPYLGKSSGQHTNSVWKIIIRWLRFSATQQRYALPTHPTPNLAQLIALTSGHLRSVLRATPIIV